MDDVLYLHGWGEDPHRSPVARALQAVLPDARILLPNYHPGGNCRATRVGQALRSLQSLIVEQSKSGQVRVAGYSFGGLLGALLAAEKPDLVTRMLLLAPAIDNVARNYANDPSGWRMPREYVNEFMSYPARPRIHFATTVVHGRLDNDQGGSAPERIEQWISEQPFTAAYLLAGVDHSLEPWLSSGTSPSFEELVRELVS